VSQLGTTTIFRGDDSQFKASLSSMENSASATFGRVAASAKNQFKGILAAKETVNAAAGLVTGLFTGFGVFTAASAAIGVITSAYDSFLGSSREVFENARKEAEQRERSAKAMNEASASLDKLGGGGISGLAASFAEIDRLKDQRNNAGFASLGNTDAANFNPEVREAALNDLALRRRAIMAETEELAQRAMEHAKGEADTKARQMEAESEIAALRASGNTLAAESMSEVERHYKAVAAAQVVLQNGDTERYNKIMDAENRRHEAEKGRITREQAMRDESARRQTEQAAAQAERERERATTQQMENSLALEMQEVERLKLSGQEAAAKALQAQVEHRRTLRAIETADGLTDAQRAERIANETRNYGLRAEALAGAGAAAGGARQGMTSAVSGLLTFSALRSNLGGTRSVQDVLTTELQKQQRLQEETNEMLRLINSKPQLDMVGRFG
jgi:hypothetical protein